MTGKRHEIFLEIFFLKKSGGSSIKEFRRKILSLFGPIFYFICLVCLISLLTQYAIYAAIFIQVFFSFSKMHAAQFHGCFLLRTDQTVCMQKTCCVESHGRVKKKKERQEPKGRSWRKKRPLSKKEEEKQLFGF